MQRSGYLVEAGKGFESVARPHESIPLPPSCGKAVSAAVTLAPGTITAPPAAGAPPPTPFQSTFHGTRDITEIGFKAAHFSERIINDKRCNKQAYEAAAAEAHQISASRPTVSTAALFRHQYPHTLGRYKGYQNEKQNLSRPAER